MKKTLSLILAVVMAVSILAGCGQEQTPTTVPSTDGSTATTTPSTAAPTTESTTAPSTEPTTEPTTKPAETQHKHDYTSKVTNPTCESKGYTTYTCSCGDSYTGNETKATGHDYKTTTVAPTQTSEGYDLHECKNCGDSYKDNYTDKLPAPTEHEHEWVYTEYVGPEACREGYVVYTCACGESYTEGTGDKLDCAWEAIEVVPPTTEEMGYTVYKCSYCGNTWTDYDKEKLPSEETSAENKNPNRGPFYDENGNIMKCTDYNLYSECSFMTNRSDTYIEVDYSMGTYYPSTCTEWGYYYFTCTICGFDYKHSGWGVPAPDGESMYPRGHAYWKTYDASPFDPHTCDRCGDIRSVDPSLASASSDGLDSIQKYRIEEGLPELIVDNTWLECAKATAAYQAQIDIVRSEQMLEHYGFDGGFTSKGNRSSHPSYSVYCDPQYTKICIAECVNPINGIVEVVYLLFS